MRLVLLRWTTVLPRTEPPPRVAAEPPPASASAAFRLPPPVDPFLARQTQRQLAQLTSAPPPEPKAHRKGFVLFQAMPGGLFSAIVHMLLFLVLSVYVANDPTGTSTSVFASSIPTKMITTWMSLWK